MLADKFVAFLKEAIGVPAKSIFCSSVNGHGIHLGIDFNAYMRDEIQKPKLVILLITPRYLESSFCLMELGATWAKSLVALPIVVPPVDFSFVKSTLGLVQSWKIDDHSKLIDLRIKVKETGIRLEERIPHDWDSKREVWKNNLHDLLQNLAPRTNVPAEDHGALQKELEETKKQLEYQKQNNENQKELITKLKAAKDSDVVKNILSDSGASSPDDRFKQLMKNISTKKPDRINDYFFRNIIMDRYGRANPINYYNNDEKDFAEKAKQLKIMDTEHPYDYLWNENRLKKLADAIKELENFLESEEAEDFISQCERQDKIIDVEDIEFWETNLKQYPSDVPF
jgi:hypothetical protein